WRPEQVKRVAATRIGLGNRAIVYGQSAQGPGRRNDLDGVVLAAADCAVGEGATPEQVVELDRALALSLSAAIRIYRETVAVHSVDGAVVQREVGDRSALYPEIVEIMQVHPGKRYILGGAHVKTNPLAAGSRRALVRALLMLNR